MDQGTRTILDTVPDLPLYRPLDIEDCELYGQWFRSCGFQVSDLTFTNLFAWRHYRPTFLSRYRDFLLVLRHHGSQPVIYSPMGRGHVLESTLAAFEDFRGKYPEIEPSMRRVPEDVAQALAEGPFVATEDRNDFDYVYWVNELVRLEGRRFESKRNRIRHCLAEHACTYEPVTRENIEECIAFEEEWCEIRQIREDPDLAPENRAIREAFAQFGRLNLLAGAVRVEGKIRAFAVGEGLDETTAVVHFEKADPAMDGLYQIINRWFCQSGLQGFTWVNREQDLGIEGLRRAKTSYCPHHFVKKFAIKSA